MRELYIANKNYSSWSLRPWLLMQQLQIPFIEQLVPFSQQGNFDKFRTFSPSGKVPCLVQKELVVWDSLAIAEFLYESHANVWPKDNKARAFARCAAAEMHSGFSALRNICGMSCGHRVQLHQITPALQQDISRLSELFEQGISQFGGPFLAGSQFSAADAFFAPVAFRMQSYALAFSAVAKNYLQLLLALPAMQDWYQQALAEPWTDDAHDQEIASYGKITADYRQLS
ncbi:MAG: glutathione S-transferase family protein [Gammaproteobacteria bacterium]|nr:glutathione S-transferase family protein [Gammaproteobacteria bacterium]MBU1556882.1 glutathione S-transferase family protein [Gammaproteobacteria bacterium]MBU2072645.1 glutathione S-transferase family protein [Gammaproteobacteria bacterium]MBU2182221.1 glutathione S-transferase family protein [Gammaproteobacteria bacterium]MBU2204835.1 glutathione S-transferase family protein [Gammaproteobacteria bacterium]